MVASDEVEGFDTGRIYLNENLTSYRRNILKQANQKRKDGLMTVVWSMDG